MSEINPTHPTFASQCNSPTLHTYQITDLTAQAIQNAQIPLQSKLTTEELTLLTDPPSTNSRDPEKVLLLAHKLMPIIDKAFFSGTVCPKLTSVEIQIPLEDRVGRMRGWFDSKTSKIYLNNELADSGNGISLSAQFVNLFVHEMTHAFLYFYTCRCDECKRVQENRNWIGHGPAWSDIITAFTNALQGVLPFTVDLGIEAGVRMDEAAGFRATDAMIDRWGLRRSEKLGSGGRVQVKSKIERRSERF